MGKSDFRKLHAKLERVEQYLTTGVKTTIGVEAVNHFKDSFRNQGFTDASLERWDDVKRRDGSSGWYGFQYGGTAARPGRVQRKAGAKTNYSPAATTRPILSGETQELMNSISYRATVRGVRVTAGVPYAQIINEGGNMKVFGKHSTKMPRRQFMGNSRMLRERIADKIKANVIKILR